ncbi:MAG: PRPP-binding protein, adenine/guanine phosphoribosyltransferase [Candidatus Bathyarchaeota archaeon B63]|nr:MAG: PRPP-binding protein, adenine/guanine phosphoribosyltransferase [Candidatus Bathyarchaeota archaeon B63]
MELLRLAKKQYTYKKLQEETKLPVTVLSRYVKGHVLPNSERAQEIWQALSRIIRLEDEIRRRLKWSVDGFFDNTAIIGDTNLLSQAANYAIAKFAGKRITKVLTAAVDGVPLATMIARALGVNVVVAKPTKEIGVSTFIEETYTLSESGHTVTLFVPRNTIRRHKKAREVYRTEKEALRAVEQWRRKGYEAYLSKRDIAKGEYEVEVLRIYDSILIVDDVIKTGDVQSALINLVKKAKAEVSGVFALIAVGDSWKRKLHLPKNCQVEVILQL